MCSCSFVAYLNYYRIFVYYYRFPHLRLLDFRKIKRAHRKEANELFKSKRGKDLLKEIARKTRSNAPNLAAIAAENQAKGKSIVDKSISQ